MNLYYLARPMNLLNAAAGFWLAHGRWGLACACGVSVILDMVGWVANFKHGIKWTPSS